jgi:hypothetical protein
MASAKKIIQRIGYFIYVFLFVITGVEIGLHIYNPFPFTQKNDNVILPRNRKMVFKNKNIPVIEDKTIHTKNSLGFRGPEMPVNFKSLNSFVAVGGSTTECFYLSDSNCWTSILSKDLERSDSTVWINNAGYQGHSTYGHFILINEYIKSIKPKHVLLLVGYNEVNRNDIQNNESVLKSSKKNTMWGWLKRNSEIINIGLNIKRHLLADRLSVTDGYVNLASRKNDILVLSKHQIDSTCSAQTPLLNAFKRRLYRIVDTCLANNIDPIVITQPILFGKGLDDITGVNLENYRIRSSYNGLLIWKLLELYNDITRKIAIERHLKLIDLAREMPKSSLYFYDICHFSNQGARKVSEILSSHLVPDSLLKRGFRSSR